MIIFKASQGLENFYIKFQDFPYFSMDLYKPQHLSSCRQGKYPRGCANSDAVQHDIQLSCVIECDRERVVTVSQTSDRHPVCSASVVVDWSLHRVYVSTQSDTDTAADIRPADCWHSSAEVTKPCLTDVTQHFINDAKTFSNKRFLLRWLCHFTITVWYTACLSINMCVWLCAPLSSCRCEDMFVQQCSVFRLWKVATRN